MFRKVMIVICLFALCFCGVGIAKEVGKAKIPDAHLVKTYKELPWGVAIWDTEEAIANLKKGKDILWIDTRPESFLKKGTVKGAVCIPYNQTGKQNDLDKVELMKAIKKAGLSKENATVVFFCQGPKCHRSYNAAYMAVKKWGLAPEKVVWFRAGYPYLFKKVKETPKLKRRAARYLSGNGVEQL